MNRLLDGLAWVVAHAVQWHRWRRRRRWMATEGAALVRWYEASAAPNATTRPQYTDNYGLIPLSWAVCWTERPSAAGIDAKWRAESRAALEDLTGMELP